MSDVEPRDSPDTLIDDIRRGKAASIVGRRFYGHVGRLLPEPTLPQPTFSAEDRFLPLTARSQDRSQTAAQGRLEPFARPSTNGRHLRNAAKEPELYVKRSCKLRLVSHSWKIPAVAPSANNRGLIVFEMAGSPCRDDLQRNPAPGLFVDRLERLLDRRWRNPKQAGIGLG